MTTFSIVSDLGISLETEPRGNGPAKKGEIYIHGEERVQRAKEIHFLAGDFIIAPEQFQADNFALLAHKYMYPNPLLVIEFHMCCPRQH